MHDKYKKTHRTPRGDDALRRKIAEEAARRLVASRGEADPDWLANLSEPDLYTAKRKAAAVLGRVVRPGDLPSDAEVRTRAAALAADDDPAAPLDDPPEPTPDGLPPRLAVHLDRFAVYRLRLIPLEAVKQGPKAHPEGDALYHSFQAYGLAREARPYDEEFLLAALLHDVGKAIDPGDHVAAGVEALRGSVTERTLWLVAHHHDLDDGPIPRGPAIPAETREDLALLRECNLGGRGPGRPVDSIDEALAYLRGLDREDDLEG